MTATTPSAEDGTPEPGHETSQTTAPETEATEGLLVGMASPDRCVECGAEMAVDQRYCVECGHRRGPARFALARTSSKSVAVVPASQSSNPSQTFVAMLAAAGIVIALLGVGVGVLIDHDAKGKPAPVKVTVSGASASGTTTPSTAKGGASGGGKSSSDSHTTTNFFSG